MGDERRRFPRIPLLSQVKVRCEGQTFTLSTRDLSVGGARVDRGDATLAAGASLSVEISLPGDGGTVTADGEVAWINDNEVGISFVDPDSEAGQRIDAAVSRELEELKSFEDMKTPPQSD